MHLRQYRTNYGNHNFFVCYCKFRKIVNTLTLLCLDCRRKETIKDAGSSSSDILHKLDERNHTLQTENSELIIENRKLRTENRELKTENGELKTENRELKAEATKENSKMETQTTSGKKLVEDALRRKLNEFGDGNASYTVRQYNLLFTQWRI